jgi:hypothetical protein
MEDTVSMRMGSACNVRELHRELRAGKRAEATDAVLREVVPAWRRSATSRATSRRCASG